MERIITLLKEKNHYLERFLEVNERELLNFSDGNFDNLEAFYNTRDKILDLIRCIDGLIEVENGRVGNAAEVSVQHRSEIEEVLRAKDGLVAEILAQDLQVLACVENEKSNIIRELQAVRKGRKAVGAYHSGAQKSPQLDEEA